MTDKECDISDETTQSAVYTTGESYHRRTRVTNIVNDNNKRV